MWTLRDVLRIFRPTWWALPLVPLCFGVVVLGQRWWAARTLWLDEQMIARNLRDRDFAALAGPLDHNQSAPLGWLWAQRAVIEIAGTDERALRAVPLAFGVGALAVAWLIGRRWLGPAGTFAVLSLLAVNAAMLRYSTEVKQYTGDVFWVLVLLGVALWVVEPAAGGPVRWSYRMVVWWTAAAVGCLFSMGAILAAPAIALVLAGAAVRRHGWPAVLRAAVAGVIWLAAFALHYWYALRHLVANEVMTDYWDGRGYPPEGAGAARLVGWIVRRPEALAGDPLHLDNAGLGRSWLVFAAAVFWLLVCAGLGVAMRRRPVVGLLLAAPLVMGVLLAVLRVAPLTVRLAMWIMPALFLAVGVEVDAAVRAAGRALRPLPTGRVGGLLAGAVGGVAVLLAGAVAAPLALAATRPIPAPGVDDRAGVTWLARQHRPGALTLVLQGSQHAVAWYAPGDTLAPAYRVRAVPYSPGCDPDALRTRLAGFDRALVYGRFRDGSAGAAAEALTARLAEVGTVIETAQAGRVGISWVVQLHPEPDRRAATDTSVCLTFT
nr:hypothetical protein [Micromonospora sp. DSM 115978]